MATKVYMAPSPLSTKQGATQFDEMLNGLRASGIALSSVWLQVTEPGKWSTNVQQNIDFIQSVLNRMRPGNIMEPAMSTVPDDFHLQPMNSHLSLFRKTTELHRKQAPTSSEAPSVAMGADSLCFELDIVLKDADGSLMSSELETVKDFNLGGGCGFDMENETSRPSV